MEDAEVTNGRCGGDKWKMQGGQMEDAGGCKC